MFQILFSIFLLLPYFEKIVYIDFHQYYWETYWNFFQIKNMRKFKKKTIDIRVLWIESTILKISLATLYIWISLGISYITNWHHILIASLFCPLICHCHRICNGYIYFSFSITGIYGYIQQFRRQNCKKRYKKSISENITLLL